MADHDERDEDMMLFSRRALMGYGMAAGGIAAGAMAASPALAAGPSLIRESGIPEDPRARIALIRRMRLRTDAGLVFWWFRGRNYAQQGANLIPLCELIFGAAMKVIPLPDGGMDVVQYELGFRTAIDSGVRTDKLRNPLTGDMIDVPFAPVGPTTVHYTPDHVAQLPSVIGGSKFTVEHVPELFYHIGDTVCFQTHSRALSETPGMSDRRLNDMSMITSPASEALNPKVRCARAFAHGTDVGDYARWWKMPAGLGNQTLRSVGQKETSWAAMPKDWLAMLASVNPAGAKDPLALLGGPEVKYLN